MPRLVDVVEKIENSGHGAFCDINNDLGLFIGKNFEGIDPMLHMSYAYARRAATAGMVLQGIAKQIDYDYVYKIFLSVQNSADTSTTREQTVEFQNKATEQSVELINSYTSLFDNEAITFIVGVVQNGNANSYFNNLSEGETYDLETIATIVNNCIQRMPKGWSNNDDYNGMEIELNSNIIEKNMKLIPQYLNTITNSIDSTPSDEFSYGISHAEIEAMPKNDIQEADINPDEDWTGYMDQMKERMRKEVVNYEPMKGPKWAIGRTIYDFSISNYQSEEPNSLWPAPSVNNYINCICAVRKFCGLPRENRKELLVNLLGFLDTGVSIGGNSKFIYEYSYEPSRIEIYISGQGSGEIKELVRYNYSKNLELRLPLEEPLAFQYIFFQVFGDLYQWNFNKLDLNHEDLKMYQRIMDIRSPLPIIDNIPTIKFSESIVEGHLVLDYYK